MSSPRVEISQTQSQLPEIQVERKILTAWTSVSQRARFPVLVKQFIRLLDRSFRWLSK